MKTYILKDIDENITEQVGLLLKKLDPSSPIVDEERLKFLVDDQYFTLFISEEDGVISGMLTLIRCSTLARDKFWIEDVVVDQRYRGRGIGRQLVQAAVEYVRENGCRSTIYLTSNPSRTAARALYRSEGFDEYDTGVFRMTV
ncbi:MAG: GNAT family N-acetyltransferase [Bacteroidales bacterium]|nr:GNAT family N-acetyltransferase [Bacteroidales bacterium]